VNLESLTISHILDAVAAKTPAPGGGAVASVTAALAAALGQMVVQYSLGKRNLTEHEPVHRQALETLRTAQHRALALADEDAHAYTRLNVVLKLDANDPRRAREMPDAVNAALAPPRQTAELGLRVLGVLQQLAGRSNRMLASDLAIAAILAEATVRAAAWNVHINLPLVGDQRLRDDLACELAGSVEKARTTCGHIEQSCR
jgi:formiminotetrahydrofolate cyclodeaminase